MIPIKRALQSKPIIAAFIGLLAHGCIQHEGKQVKSPNAGYSRAEMEKNIYTSGDSMLAVFKRKDWLGFVKYMHPNLTKRMEGDTAFAAFVALQMKKIPRNAIKDVRLGRILQVVKTPHDEQCVVEQQMTMEVDGVEFDKTTYLVGESRDGGNAWTFFDASTKTALTAKEIKPDLSDELKIPNSKGLQ